LTFEDDCRFDNVIAIDELTKERDGRTNLSLVNKA
jgi:hypothetical protein